MNNNRADAKFVNNPHSAKCRPEEVESLHPKRKPTDIAMAIEKIQAEMDNLQPYNRTNSNAAYYLSGLDYALGCLKEIQRNKNINKEMIKQ